MRTQAIRAIMHDQLDTVVNNSPRLYRFEAKDKRPINSDRRFWEAAIATFPLNPPIKVPKSPIGALQDSMFGGLLREDDAIVDIMWPFADNVPRRFLTDKVGFFNDLAWSLHPDDPERIAHNESGVRLRLYLVCANENNRQSLEGALAGIG